MKMKPLGSLLAATAICAFPVMAADEPAAAEAVAEAAAQETVSLTIVTCKGGGWGAANRVRAALANQEGANKVIISGLQGIVVMEEGKKLDEAKVTEALKAKRMQFVSLVETEMAVPKATYVLQAEGATWAVTNDKARVALEKMDNVAGAIVDKTVTILLVEDEPLDEKAVAEALKSHKIAVTETQKSDTLPF